MKNDLCSISAINDIFKYADDTTLLVPLHTDVELDVELVGLVWGFSPACDWPGFHD